MSCAISPSILSNVYSIQLRQRALCYPFEGAPRQCNGQMSAVAGARKRAPLSKENEDYDDEVMRDHVRTARALGVQQVSCDALVAAPVCAFHWILNCLKC